MGLGEIAQNRELAGNYFYDNIDVMGGEAQIFKIPASNRIWQLKMCIRDEKRQFRKSLKTRDQNEAMRLGKFECAKIIGMSASGKNCLEQSIEMQEERG